MKKAFLIGLIYLIVMSAKKCIELTNNICSQHQSHRILVTCTFCQNDFRTFNTTEVRCLDCCWLTERKMKKYTLEESEKSANVCNIKRRKKEYTKDESVRKVDNKTIL